MQAWEHLHHLQVFPEASASQQLDCVAPAHQFPGAAAAAEAAARCPAPLLHFYQKSAPASVVPLVIPAALSAAVAVIGALQDCQYDNCDDDDDYCQLTMS